MKKIILFFMLSCLMAVRLNAQAVQSTGGTNTSLSAGFTGILPDANGGTNTSLTGLGTGAVVHGTNTTLTTPILGVATATSVNKYTFVAPATSASVTVANGKALTISNTMTLEGTDGQTFTFTNGSGTIATTTATATLTNKTLTAPVIADFTSAAHDHLDADDGGQLTMGAMSDYVAPTDISGVVAFTGYSVAPTVQFFVYSKIGKTVTVWYSFTGGTSNATTLTVTGLPVAASGTNYGFMSYQNNSVFATTTAGLCTMINAGTTMIFHTDLSGAGAWTASNSKGAYGTFIYRTP